MPQRRNERLVIKELRLLNVRNYEQLIYKPQKGLNILCGQNGQGKTNVLEAIYMCCIGKSFRAANDKEIIKWGNETAKLHLQAQTGSYDTTVDILLNSNGKKAVNVDGIPIVRLAELIGRLNAVVFSPEDLKLVKEAPKERRRYIDIVISQVRPSYYYSLSLYTKALHQRNKLLKDCIKNERLIKAIPAFDIQLAKYATDIIIKRNEYIKNLGEIAKKYHEQISGGKEELLVQYQPSIICENTKDIYDAYLKKLDEKQKDDIKYGVTSVGPHKDDIKLIVSGTDARIYSSQGQQRTVALSLRLSEAKLIKKETGHMPVLLLDDILSELDESRQKYLIDHLETDQAFITVAGKAPLNNIGKIASNISYVQKGVLRPITL